MRHGAPWGEADPVTACLNVSAGRPDSPLFRIRQLTSPAPRGPLFCLPSQNTAAAVPFRPLPRRPIGLQSMNHRGGPGASNLALRQQLRQ